MKTRNYEHQSRIRNIRNSLDLTQKEFALLVGVSLRQVQRWEYRLEEPRRKYLVRTVDALEEGMWEKESTLDLDSLDSEMLALVKRIRILKQMPRKSEFDKKVKKMLSDLENQINWDIK